MKYYNIIFILFIFQSCNTTTLSEKEVNNISNIQAKILIEDVTKQHSLNKINVFLSNGKKKIINKDIKIQLNGKPLELFVRTGNYYDKYPVYTTDQLERRESYYFEIILPDSTKYPIAFIKPSELTTDFNFPKSISIDKDFVLKWTELNTPFQFEYIKGVEYEQKEDNITEYAYDGRHIDTLKTKQGQYVIPKSYFIDSLKRTKRLETILTSKETGLINPELKQNSSITYNYVIENRIDLEKK